MASLEVFMFDRDLEKLNKGEKVELNSLNHEIDEIEKKKIQIKEEERSLVVKEKRVKKRIENLLKKSKPNKYSIKMGK